MAKRTFEDGIAIFRSIAESDAFKEMRGRIRDGASRVAESDRVPRVLAGSAGILAALLTDVDEEELPLTEELEPMVDEPSEMVVPSASDATDDEDDEFDEEEVPDSVAAVRDLDGAAPLDTPMEEEEDDELEDDDGPIAFGRSDEGSDGLSKAAPQVGVADVAAEPLPEPTPVRVEPQDAGSKLLRRSTKPPPKRRSIPPMTTKSANAAGGAAKRAKAAKKAAAKGATEPPAPEAKPLAKNPVKAGAKKETGAAATKRKAPSKSGDNKKPVVKAAKKTPRTKTKKSS